MGVMTPLVLQSMVIGSALTVTLVTLMWYVNELTRADSVAR
jgi:multisubunit Na+/H+ antiporter MnhC subunit